MKTYQIINIKKDMPNSEYAIFLMEREIDACRAMDIHVLIVIHGYGSSGAGGTIKKDVKEVLIKLKHFRKIVDFVEGEKCGQSNEVFARMCEKFPDLIVCDQIENLNSGVTVIWIK